MNLSNQIWYKIPIFCSKILQIDNWHRHCYNNPRVKTWRNYYMYTLLNELLTRDVQFNGDSTIELDDSFVLSIELPGVKKDDITLDIEGSYLTVKAKKKSPFDKKSKILMNTRSFQPFEKSYKVGSTIDTSNINAEFIDGVLTITLAKKEGKLNRTIEIK